MIANELLLETKTRLLRDQPPLNSFPSNYRIRGCISQTLAERFLREAGFLGEKALDSAYGEGNLLFWGGCRLTVVSDEKNEWAAMWVVNKNA